MDEKPQTFEPPEPFESDPVRARGARNPSREAAGYRVKLRASEKEVESLRSRLAELEATGAPIANSAPQSAETSDEDDPEIEQLLAAIEAESERLAETLLAESGALLPSESLAILRARREIVFDDSGLPALLIDGTPTPIARAALEKILAPQLMRSAGVAGAGSHAPRQGTDDFNFERGLHDARYFRQNRDRMRAEMKRRMG
jgi:hypothetical protein